MNFHLFMPSAYAAVPRFEDPEGASCLQVADKSCKAARAGPRTSGNQKRCKSRALGPCRNSECDSYAVAWPRLASRARARRGGGEEYIQIRRAEIRIRIGGVSSDTCLRIGDRWKVRGARAHAQTGEKVFKSRSAERPRRLCRAIYLARAISCSGRSERRYFA